MEEYFVLNKEEKFDYLSSIKFINNKKKNVHVNKYKTLNKSLQMLQLNTKNYGNAFTKLPINVTIF